MSSDNKVAYFNTLIFTIVTGIVSLIVMSLLLFQIGKTFMIFIITFEIGVFIIIGMCIYQIVKAEKDKNEKHDYMINIDQCPDYYSKVKNSSNQTDYCLNWYRGKDMYGEETIQRLFPMKDKLNEDISIPPSFENSFVDGDPTTSTNNYMSFELLKLQNDKNFDQSKKCGFLFTKATGTNTASYEDHYLVPWSYARSRCQSLTDFA